MKLEKLPGWKTLTKEEKERLKKITSGTVSDGETMLSSKELEKSNKSEK